MKISGSAKVVCIFGDPVSHSLSPAMHNAAFEALALDMAYVPFHVPVDPPGGLKRAVSAVRALDIHGLNITIPHKERVMGYLDEVDGHARAVGAVNTVVNRGGSLIGSNTDGDGYLQGLRHETGFTPRGKKVVLIGAGGAARSILYSVLLKKPRSLVLVNRTGARATSLAREFERKLGVKISTAPLERDALHRSAQGAHLVVNTTSIGLNGRGEIDFPMEVLPDGAVVSDIVYSPLETSFLKKASKRGLKTHDGLSMLVYQGAIGFKLWTGRKAPVDVMRAAALAAISSRKR
ncbi:MAG: shikimate dehydrogenase [Thermodesulfobacteriota bacterium]|nr:MAG: shikimate dehydrogenase [Thermodesulfobacteriota bacterium]